MYDHDTLVAMSAFPTPDRSMDRFSFSLDQMMVFSQYVIVESLSLSMEVHGLSHCSPFIEAVFLLGGEQEKSLNVGGKASLKRKEDSPR